jgi:carbon storage regulator
MLVLSQKKDQTIVIGDNIRITVTRIDGNRVTLGIDAPKTTKIQRVKQTTMATKTPTS